MNSFTLTNARGDTVMILEHGASLYRWSTVVGQQHRDIILSYPSLHDYQQDRCYLGAVVGPYANRIKGGKIYIDQQCYQLEQNEGSNQLHGGRLGLQKMRWHKLTHTPTELVLGCNTVDGYGGYPGPIQFTLRYQLGSDGTLDVHFHAWADCPTLVGPTLHPYFNLATTHTNIDTHKLWLNADLVTVTDEHKIPTGDLRHIANTALDFRQPKMLEALSLDHNFAVTADVQQPAAILTSPDGRLQLFVSSDYPGLQVYTGDYLPCPFAPRQGLCLEPQFYPDSPNHRHFPFHYTRPGQPFVAHLRYQLVQHL